MKGSDATTTLVRPCFIA